MTRTDANHKIAKIIKEHDDRLANLEEKDRQTATPNLLRTLRDTVIADDTALSAESYDMAPAKWDDIDTRGGYTVGTWGSRL